MLFVALFARRDVHRTTAQHALLVLRFDLSQFSKYSALQGHPDNGGMYAIGESLNEIALFHTAGLASAALL